MADIDFDELDKAVNTLMSGVKQPSATATAEPGDTPKPAPDETEEDMASAAETASQETTEQPTKAQSKADEATSTAPASGVEDEPTAETSGKTALPSTAPAEQKSLATKRRGQFMDMKHPSADMKTTPIETPAKAPRVGITIAPLTATDDKSDEPTPPNNDVEQVAESPAEVETPEIEIPEVPMPEMATEKEPSTDATDTPEATHGEPKPADVAAPADELHLAPPPERAAEPSEVEEPKVDLPATDAEPAVNTETEPEEQSESATEQEPATPVEEPAADEPAPSSPFLPDAKVEKRPLGQPAQVDEPVLAAESEAAVNSTSLPEELHDSVLAVEADTTINKATSAEPAEVTAPDDGTDKPADASIPNQYKTADTGQTDATTEPDTSLYDTAGQHDAFAASPKRSHWAIVLGIIVIIILGAAIGAGAYVLQAGLI